MTGPNLTKVRPRPDLEGDYLDYLLDFAAHGERSPAQACLEAVRARIASDLRSEAGLGSPERPRSVTFWFFEDETLVGTSRLRPHLNERFWRVGGHIGYEVRPSRRRQGLGTEILVQTLAEARTLGLPEVLVTCDADNHGSRGVLNRVEGQLIEEFFDEVTARPVARYQVSTSSRP